MSSIVIGKPDRWSSAYSDIDAWPFDRTKRSRLGHSGSVGSTRRYLVHRTSAMSAMPIGAPGWPLLAFCTASIASVFSVSTASCSTSFVTANLLAGRLAPVFACPPVSPARLKLLPAEPMKKWEHHIRGMTAQCPNRGSLLVAMAREDAWSPGLCRSFFTSSRAGDRRNDE